MGCGASNALRASGSPTAMSMEKKRPTQQDIKNSVCLYVYAELVYDTTEMPHIKDHESFRAHAASGAFAPWAGVKGLRNKIFWFHPETNSTGGLYTFFNRSDLDEYMKTELWGMMTQIPFLTNVRHEIHENLAGGELCADLGTWNVSKGKGPVVKGDLRDCWMLEPRFKIKTKVLPNKSMDDFKGMLASGATQPWASVAGLRNKYFTLWGDSMGAGFYSFKSKKEVDAYMKSELWAGMGQMPHIGDLSFKLCEILEGGECCTDLGQWPQAK